MTSEPRPSLTSICIAGFRRNRIPALVLQSFAALLLCLYFLVPAARPVFQAIADFRTRVGLPFVAVSSALFGGLIPALVLLHRGRIPRGQRVKQLAFFVLYWAFQGMVVDRLYTLQGHWFGHGTDVMTLLKKVLVDQLPFNLLWGTPTAIFFYGWKDAGFSLQRLLPQLRPPGVWFRFAAIQISSWTVWIPAVTMLYCLPPALQMPMNNLILCFFTLLLNFVSRESAAPQR
jgi:hypothetical protein